MKSKLSKPKSVDYDLNKIKEKATPHLNAIQKKVNKILKATAASYIPEACEALKQDWVPHMTDETLRLRENMGLQKEMRNKILRTFCIGLTDDEEDGIWTEVTFRGYWPDWLRNPTQQAAAELNIPKANQAKLEKKISSFNAEAQTQRKSLERIADNLPELPPTIHQLTQEHYSNYQYREEDEPTEFQSLGGKQTILGQYGEINKPAQDLIRGLSMRNKMPGIEDDLIVDHIKPTREARRSFVLEVMNSNFLSINGIQRHLAWCQAFVDDMLEIIEEETAKAPNKDNAKELTR